LVRRSDVLIENFRPGGLAALGLGVDHLQAANPRLVVCSISGYGPAGPWKDRPGYDFIAQAMSGLMSITGEPDGEPMKVGVAVLDLACGALAATAILAALLQRAHTRRGEHIQLSLLETGVSCLANVGQAYLVAGRPPRRQGNAHAQIVPYQLFPTADRTVVIGAGNDEQFRRLCAALGCAELAADPCFATNAARVEHRDALVAVLGQRTRTWQADALVETLCVAGVPAGAVLDLPAVFAHPHVQACGIVVEAEHPALGPLKLLGTPFHLREGAAGVRRHPPMLGEHNAEVYGRLGVSKRRLRELQTAGVI
jgi:crotonobetainyl-CoA:carnitine CoA-transferase CaiB-like acyl-CoA transferase